MRRLLSFAVVLAAFIRVAAAEPVRFVAIGDQGAGNEAQRAVAAAMANVCALRGCDFVLGTGDNFYSTTNGPWTEYDPQFATLFEEPFAAVELPFFMSLGNHDQGLDVIYPLADAQVRYSYRTDRPSEKWRMPWRWYQHDHGDVAFFALDTSTLSSDGRALVTLSGALGLPDVTRDLPDPYQDLYREPQLHWLRRAIAGSEAGWKVAYGHHPYASNGEHGDGPPDYRALVESTLCGEVDVFIAGHDHHLEWLEPVDTCPGTELLVSGAGSLPRAVEDRRSSWFKLGDTAGFLWLEIDGERLTVAFYDGAAALRFERSQTR